MRLKLTMLGLFLPLLISCGVNGAVPEGAYLRTEFSGGQLSNVIYVFAEGRVAYAAKGDLEHVDFDAHAATRLRNVGTWQRTGETLRIVWGDGSVQEGPIRLDKSGGGFQFNGAPFAPIERVADASRLKGRYYGGASYGGMSNAFDLVFDGAGGYRHRQAASIASTSSASQVSGGASRAEGGRYALSGTRLTLGDESHWAYEVPVKDSTAAEMLIIDGVVMTRED